MTQAFASISAAADYYRAEFAALDASFARNGDGAAACDGGHRWWIRW